MTTTTEWPTWTGQQTGARWIDSQEYLELWMTLPSRWALPTPTWGTDPSAPWYHRQPTQFSELIPVPARGTFSSRWLTLADRLLGTRAADQTLLEGEPTCLLTTPDSEPSNWQWADSQAPTEAVWMMVRAAKAVLADNPHQLADQVAEPWEKPHLLSAWAPLIWPEPQPLGEPTRRLMWRLAYLAPTKPAGVTLGDALNALNPSMIHMTGDNWVPLLAG
jgi:hypothetical protein